MKVMTAAELIAELQRYPGHMPVKVRVEGTGEFDDSTTWWYEAPVDGVVHEGAFLCLEIEP